MGVPKGVLGGAEFKFGVDNGFLGRATRFYIPTGPQTPPGSTPTQNINMGVPDGVLGGAESIFDDKIFL